ncbi:hypothetical protein F5878DRAFT_647317 [Lentinula raphanica]|uniref:Uncharacterized protein n=1 Tax=Lentinula raphanica TaxID=153919 RepID=A0AA38NWB1_9AGAR|nr:hypothetical protein F5878DRAFT_647317 [Lentinula raphanica]
MYCWNKFFFSAGHQACGAPPAEKKEKPTKWQRFFYPFISGTQSKIVEQPKQKKEEKNSPAPSEEDLPANIHGHDHTKNVKVQPGLPRGGVQPGATHKGVQPGALSPPAVRPSPATGPTPVHGNLQRPPPASAPIQVPSPGSVPVADDDYDEEEDRVPMTSINSLSDLKHAPLPAVKIDRTPHHELKIEFDLNGHSNDMRSGPDVAAKRRVSKVVKPHLKEFGFPEGTKPKFHGTFGGTMADLEKPVLFTLTCYGSPRVYGDNHFNGKVVGESGGPGSYLELPGFKIWKVTEEHPKGILENRPRWATKQSDPSPHQSPNDPRPSSSMSNAGTTTEVGSVHSDKLDPHEDPHKDTHTTQPNSSQPHQVPNDPHPSSSTSKAGSLSIQSAGTTEVESVHSDDLARHEDINDPRPSSSTSKAGSLSIQSAGTTEVESVHSDELARHEDTNDSNSEDSQSEGGAPLGDFYHGNVTNNGTTQKTASDARTGDTHSRPAQGKNLAA